MNASAAEPILILGARRKQKLFPWMDRLQSELRSFRQEQRSMARIPKAERPHNLEVENEMLRPPKRSGEPPRPATEPPRAADARQPAKGQRRGAMTRDRKA